MLSSREYLLRLVPLQQFPVVGVSFEGRQEVIPQLQKGALQRDLSLAALRMPAACSAH